MNRLKDTQSFDDDSRLFLGELRDVVRESQQSIAEKKLMSGMLLVVGLGHCH